MTHHHNYTTRLLVTELPRHSRTITSWSMQGCSSVDEVPLLLLVVCLPWSGDAHEQDHTTIEEMDT